MKVTITIQDTDENGVNCSVDFDPPLNCDEGEYPELRGSAAAHMASRFLDMIRKEAEAL